MLDRSDKEVPHSFQVEIYAMDFLEVNILVVAVKANMAVKESKKYFLFFSWKMVSQSLL